MTVVAILLGIGCIYLAVNRILTTRELKRMAKEIEQMGSDSSGRQMNVQMMNREFVDLAVAVNDLQQHHRDEVAEYIRREEEHKQSMADISHDLRTPLTAMKGYLKLLRKEGLEAEKQKEYVEIAYDKSNTLNRLVTSLFELARLESEVYPFEWECVDIREMLEQEAAAFYPEFLKRKLEPDVRIQETKMPIRADHTAVQRILNNLIRML